MPRDVGLELEPSTLEKGSNPKEAAKACAAELIKENGGHQHVAERLGLSAVRLYNFTNRNNPEQISLSRCLELTSAKATAAARLVARFAGGVFFPLALRRGDARNLVADSARSSGEAIAEASSALADGHVDAREEAEVTKDIDAAIANLASLRSSIVAEAGAK